VWFHRTVEESISVSRFRPERWTTVLALGTLAWLTASPSAAQTGSRAPELEQLVGYIRVFQGDTLDARNGRGRVLIGILGIKAPNGNTPCGKEATALTEELVSGGVEVYEEPGLVLDARMRRMYNIMTLDGRSIAEELVTGGLARADGQGANHDRLAELEVAAREEKRGCLWSSGG